MNETRKITVFGTISEGIGIGIKNAASIIVALILWVLTIWIPYVNVGTTIAICTIPIALSKGNVISPLFIFDGKYRKYMGEFFTLIGMMLLSIIPAMLFMVIPGIIIAIGWSLALYILLDKGVAPGEAMIKSNKATYGYKWTIFGVSFVLGILYYIVFLILLGIMASVNSDGVGFFIILLMFALFIVYYAAHLGCYAVIYRNLTREEEKEKEDIEDETIVIVE